MTHQTISLALVPGSHGNGDRGGGVGAVQAKPIVLQLGFALLSAQTIGRFQMNQCACRPCITACEAALQSVAPPAVGGVGGRGE